MSFHLHVVGLVSREFIILEAKTSSFYKYAHTNIISQILNIQHALTPSTHTLSLYTHSPPFHAPLSLHNPHPSIHSLSLSTPRLASPYSHTLSLYTHSGAMIIFDLYNHMIAFE